MGTAKVSEEQYRRYLYSPERLAFRERIFTTLTVPAIENAAENFDIRHIVSYSQSLPDQYKDSLQDTAEKFPFLVLQELPDGVSDWGPAEQRIKKLIKPGVFGRYRLDDDDVLSKHYFELMSKYIKDEFAGMVVSLPLGIEAIYHDDHFYNFREVHVPMNSMGMLFVSKLGDDGTVFGPRAGAHDKADRIAPVIIDSRKLGYLRVNHTGQDNLLRHHNDRVYDQLLTNMGKYPAVKDLKDIREGFPAVADKILQTSSMVMKEWSAPVGDGIQLHVDGETSGMTITIRGSAPEGVRKHPLALSLSLVSASGRHLGPRKQVAGIATSLNAAIGQFTYFDVSGGDFTSSASVFVPGETRIRSARIIPLVSDAKDIEIESISIDYEGSQISVATLGSATRRLLTGEQPIRGIFNQVAMRLKSALMPWMTRVLGAERANSIVGSVADKLKRR